ncbi:GDSL-type esterase/lipase family protein [Neobacillus niacini]|uniref:GDSL-type esterase/lipase family protein n=1 Tax=Neobacillus niacini TaxID=86668 RepID=UPI0028615117|nr:GDSL-type esterase/lipase family protein [Neobacillus niacini]MDR7002165.1 lysophospholipase L1-like esterase [Neobacillus niacini]
MSDLHEHHHHHHHCFQYTALGNSIAFGEGASFHVNDTENHGYGYVYYFRDFLSTIFPCVNLSNLAHPGDTSTNLLQKLQTEVFREAVKKADLITISIGANDLLICLRQPDPTIPACLSNAVATFAQNWPLIMREIRKSIRSHAEILVMTVYNPFIGGTPFFMLAEPFIQGINDVIKANRFTFHYKVVDVHADFLGQFTNTTQPKVCIWTHSCENPVPPNFLPNPHPTDCGHLEIARLHEFIYLKNHPDKLCY